jgi:hypothetical protein
VTVAEERARQASADQDNPTFVPASSAAMEAYVMSQKKGTEPDKMHPLFRRRSSSVSATAGAAASGSKPGKGKSKAKQPERKAKQPLKAEEDIFEVLSSDEEAGRAKASEDSGDSAPKPEDPSGR